MLYEILNREYFQNRVADYLIFLAILVAGIFLVTVFKKVVLWRLRRWAETTKTKLDDFIIDVFRKMLVPLAYYAVFYLATGNLNLNRFMERTIEVAGIFLLTFLVAQFLIAVARFSIRSYIETQERGSAQERSLKGFMTLIRIVVWGLAAVFFLDNLGFRINTVIAGLGIGGIAIALAAQNILGDLFAYFIIMFDRPFEIGDFIIVGEYMGAIEHLGMKTTRISSLGGEQIVVSNKDLTDSRVRNYKRMQRRRVVFRIGVTYQTPLSKLREIPEVIAGIIQATEDTAFDRAHFFSYGDFSLIFEVVYYVLGSDYTKYMTIQEQINFRIHEEFEKRSVEFAYPTQTLYLSKVPQS
ncbi:MAG TPA: mechanosensitive ion channel family protein [Candidatus Deferrimicrobiaceae bacterium]|nr:mechanosensitive ion channel family protein [Candidatus Deferrimicrobiaceae bacterium]